MKSCPRCHKTYTDNDLNFCLDDGELLTQTQGEEPTRPLRVDDSPPTVVLDPPRQTNPISWAQQPPPQQTYPPTQWQSAQPQPQQNYAFAPHPMMMRSGPNQTLPIVSLCLGIASITVGWCCYLGVLMGPAAIVTGVIGLVQNKNNPDSYGGKGLALAGVIMGALYFVGLVLFILLYGAAIFLGNR